MYVTTYQQELINKINYHIDHYGDNMDPGHYQGLLILDADKSIAREDWMAYYRYDGQNHCILLGLVDDVNTWMDNNRQYNILAYHDEYVMGTIADNYKDWLYIVDKDMDYEMDIEMAL